MRTEPICKTARGYDTNVQLHPKETYSEGKPETHRTAMVTCTQHKISACKTFSTCGLLGANIESLQKKAFSDCFDAVELACNNRIELDTLKVI